MKKSPLALIAATVLSAGLGVSAAPGAQAASADTDADWLAYPDGVSVSAQPMKPSDCRAGWVCLFEHSNFQGRRLQWSDPGTRIRRLSDYGFNDKMSSWINNSRYDAKWYRNANFDGNTNRGYCMDAGSRSARVSPNDVASSFAIFTDNRAC